MVETQKPDEYISDQAPMVLRKVAARFHYDQLRGEAPSAVLCEELQKAVVTAGVQVLKFQLTDLKYDPQIAASMLARQQAVAQVDAKRSLVHGAAETASSTMTRLKQLGHNFSPENEQRLIHDLLLKNLDPDYKAQAMIFAQRP